MTYDKLLVKYEGKWYSHVCPGQLWMEDVGIDHAGDISTIVVLAPSRLFNRSAYGQRWQIVGTLVSGQTYTYDGWYPNDLAKRLL